MARLSSFFLPTLREDPADAESVSHRLVVRAGLARQLGAGLWTSLPALWRAHRRCEQIIREEMDAIGAQEMLMPLIQPIELWQRTGRAQIEELFKLRDRREAELVLAMTHEEAVTWHVAREVRSYRQLPLILYQFQLKARDEPRPRAGLLRVREFVMKDAYSFDRDAEGLERSYELHRGAYARIFDRAGLEWYEVESDVGMMGGSGAHEYMAPCPAGENEIALSDAGYAANVEIARGTPRAPGDLPAPRERPEKVHTPGQRTIEEVAAFLAVPPAALVKALPVRTESGRVLVALVRGDHRLNEVKLRNHLGEQVRQLTAEEIERELHVPPGYIGPVGLGCALVADEALRGLRGLVTGANEADAHLVGVEPGRDFDCEWADIRRVEAGDRCPRGGTIRIEAAIEVGNIFKLGTRYSEPLGATFLDEQGRERPIVMGSYGIGPARVVAAAIEQRSDEAGIVWPTALAPFDLHIVALGRPGERARQVADRLYVELRARGLSALYDDRDTATPGEKFNDADLLGLPWRVTVGRKGVEQGVIDLRSRDGETARQIAIERAADELAELVSAGGQR
ncbi:proline--tRNA ligase [Thermoleophilum album]|jgi:prolyl-tRNA synthetase|uniref:proline--tRNA ligase n=1 Tax=Thermoleophilum album TaxID=29539 RepID=UPI00237C8972|nr:proline--tRNA ligase [Thermoleophilum album]WDT94598.1 proline--tRNA ligase [Thermoleophilum album]